MGIFVKKIIVNYRSVRGWLSIKKGNRFFTTVYGSYISSEGFESV